MDTFQKCFAVLFCLVLLKPSLCMSNGEDTIAHIEQLISEGKIVAILVIDMQPKYSSLFWESERVRVMAEQLKVITHFSDNESVHLVDVKWWKGGKVVTPCLNYCKP